MSSSSLNSSLSSSTTTTTAAQYYAKLSIESCLEDCTLAYQDPFTWKTRTIDGIILRIPEPIKWSKALDQKVIQYYKAQGWTSNICCLHIHYKKTPFDEEKDDHSIPIHSSLEPDPELPIINYYTGSDHPVIGPMDIIDITYILQARILGCTEKSESAGFCFRLPLEDDEQAEQKRLEIETMLKDKKVLKKHQRVVVREQ